MSLDSGEVPAVDVLILSRPNTVPPPAVIDSIRSQSLVTTRLIHHVGHPDRADGSRWATIARARNEAKTRAVAPWVMFVDDDVVLDKSCIRTLVDALVASPALGAIAADYTAERLKPDWSGHVTMGATLFRGELLKKLTFRSTDERCECQCCCDDLRQRGIGITYCAPAGAVHLRESKQTPSHAKFRSEPGGEPTIFAAFDRRDVSKFENQFLHTLRAWGNRETVMAVAYGLYPSEVRRVERLPGVILDAKPDDGRMTPVRRIEDFARLAQRLAPGTPVAYWDVADVFFQTSLEGLWRQVQSSPNHLLAVVEPKGYPDNQVIPAWSLSIRNAAWRLKAFDLLKRSPFLNSGFAAGTARVMADYFAHASRMRRGDELTGTTDWGDQMCLNLYCHLDPRRWRAIDERWNYCVHDRPVDEVHVTPRGQIVSRKIGIIPVAHGNARSLRQFSLAIRPQ